MLYFYRRKNTTLDKTTTIFRVCGGKEGFNIFDYSQHNIESLEYLESIWFRIFPERTTAKNPFCDEMLMSLNPHALPHCFNNESLSHQIALNAPKLESTTQDFAVVSV